MNNSRFTAQEVVTPKVVCDELLLGGTKLNNIAENYETADKKALINKEILDMALLDIKVALKSIDPEGDLFQDLAVISLSQVDSYFNVPSNFIMNNWAIADNCAKCPGNTPDNSLVINGSAFAQPGTYMITVEFNNVPSGYVELRKNNSWIATFREPGETTVSFTIDDISTDVISFVGININKNEAVSIDRLSVYYVTDRLQEFIREKIRTQVNIDSKDFVTKDDYLHSQDEFNAQFESMTTRYLAELSSHIIAINPHNITPEIIGAAPVDHEHTGYVTSVALNSLLSSRLVDYALADHTHSNYLTNDQMQDIIKDAMSQQLSNMVTIPPAIITEAPIGLLPSRLSQTDITPPINIILPSLIDHCNNSSFDSTAGIVTTNQELLMTEAPKVFSLDDQYANVLRANIVETASFRIQLHSKRTISSYTIRCKGGKLTDWKVYSGNTNFIHRVTNPTNYQVIAGVNTCSITFADPIEVDSLAFILLDATTDIELKIELTLADTSSSNILITKDQFGVCIPTAGANRVVTYSATNKFKKVAAPAFAYDLPCYIFAKAELNSTPGFTCSYYPPEYGNVRKGINIFANKFQSNISTTQNGEAYVSQVYGKLSLIEGVSDKDNPLINIYNGTDSWYTEPNTNRATIEQTIISDDVLLMGYSLSWKKTDANYVPKVWTLTVEGIDENGVTVSVVYDSVDQYYPFYSVEDDDIVYHAKFSNSIRVKKLTLTVETDRTDGVVSLNNLSFFLSERFYSIPQNKMYKGNKEVSETYIGSAIYGDNSWTPINSCLGKFCVVPVNNLQKTTPDTAYTVNNPFLTTDIQVEVKHYNLMEEDEIPDAYITSVTPDTITVMCNTSYIYALSINRAW